MKKMLAAVACGGLAYLSLGPLSIAGEVKYFRVSVNLDENQASGDLRSARHDPADGVMIRCEATLGLSVPYARCEARDWQGDYTYCWTFDPSMIQAVSQAMPGGFIYFQYDPNHQCSAVQFSVDSRLID